LQLAFFVVRIYAKTVKFNLNLWTKVQPKSSLRVIM
jgi:hypothetical protein